MPKMPKRLRKWPKHRRHGGEINFVGEKLICAPAPDAITRLGLLTVHRAHHSTKKSTPGEAGRRIQVSFLKKELPEICH